MTRNVTDADVMSMAYEMLKAGLRASGHPEEPDFTTTEGREHIQEALECLTVGMTKALAGLALFTWKREQDKTATSEEE
jgi:hypothetical protein